MITLLVRAKGPGRVVSWRQFRQGHLVDQPRLGFTPTTVLTDVVTRLWAEAQRLDPDATLKVLLPNGFMSASFDLLIAGATFQILCGRRLVRGWFPLNPFAAEFGSNYDVIVTVSSPSSDLEIKIMNLI